MAYKKNHRLMNMPRVRVQRLTATGSANRIYSAVVSRSQFIAAIVSLKLVHGDTAEAGNLPNRFEIYGVEDSADAAGTRVLVAEKDFTGVAGWSGTMQIEVDETHFGALLGKNDDGTPKSLNHMQVAISGPNNEVYEVVTQFCDPYTQSKALLDEANT